MIIDESVLSRLKERPDDSHKGTFGTLSILCGSANMPGAAYLSACAALRSGVGLLRIAAADAVRPILQSRLAEPVWITEEQLTDGKSTAFLCGCGLGRTSDDCMTNLLPQISCPAVYDADALNFLAAHPAILQQLRKPFIITPHPAEFSRLTGLSVEDIQKNRAHTASSFAVKYQCVVVLKGHRTVVALPDGTVMENTTGSSALAKGGSGDVLAGVIASLLAQGHSCEDAAAIGVYAHGLAGDRLTEKFGERCVLPSDLPAEIGRILSKI